MTALIPLLGPVEVGGDAACSSAFPGRPGVVVMERGDAPALVAACGDVRAFVRRRLDREGGDGPARVRWCACGSVIEADLAFFEVSLAVRPEACVAAADRWRAWFVRLDPDDAAPAWRKAELREAAPVSPEAAERLIGPFRDKHAAAKAGAALDEAFELCREPARLARAPRAEPCVYKEMGRCPAPCDGSEPMDGFRGRVRGVLVDAACGMTAAAERLGGLMAASASAMDFGGAAAAKLRLDALARFDAAGARRATTLATFGVLMVLPAGRAGWARLIAHAGGVTAWVASFRPDAAEAGGLIERAAGWCRAAAASGTVDWAGAARAGLVCSHLYGKALSYGTLVAVGRGADSPALLRWARRAAKIEAGPAEPGPRDGAGGEPVVG